MNENQFFDYYKFPGKVLLIDFIAFAFVESAHQSVDAIMKVDAILFFVEMKVFYFLFFCTRLTSQELLKLMNELLEKHNFAVLKL